jgi:hypothetical protein
MSIRGGIVADSRAREATLEAVITRADGRIERLGSIAYWHRNPLKRFAWKLKRIFERNET